VTVLELTARDSPFSSMVGIGDETPSCRIKYSKAKTAEGFTSGSFFCPGSVSNEDISGSLLSQKEAASICSNTFFIF